MTWFILLAGLGLIWGIFTDNLAWGLIIGAAAGWFLDYFMDSSKDK